MLNPIQLLSDDDDDDDHMEHVDSKYTYILIQLTKFFFGHQYHIKTWFHGFTDG